MSQQVFVPFLLTLFAGISTGIGSAIAFFAKRTNTSSLSLGLSAGVMIYVSFVELFTSSVQTLVEMHGKSEGTFYATLSFFGGIVLILLIDKLIPRYENPHEMHRVEEMSEKAKIQLDVKPKLLRVGMVTALVLAIHNFPEGMVTFLAALKDVNIAIPIAIAIAIHNIPEGISVSVPVFYATGNRKKAFWFSFLSGLAEPVGAVIGYLVLAPFLDDNVFGIIFGNYAAFSSYSQITSIPICLISLLLMNKIARQMGQKASMLVGTWGGIIGSIAITLFLFFFNPKGDASKFSLPAFRLIRPDTWGTLFTGWTTTALIFVLLVIAWSGVQALSSSIVITMTADCADYEVYRTGKYVPGLMGTLFSFVDKLISSLAATLVALFYSVAGFKDALPDTMTPYSDGIFWATIGCFVLLPIVGWLCNVVAMHFYPLTKEKMAEIQAEIGRIKAEAAAKQA